MSRKPSENGQATTGTNTRKAVPARIVLRPNEWLNRAALEQALGLRPSTLSREIRNGLPVYSKFGSQWFRGRDVNRLFMGGRRQYGKKLDIISPEKEEAYAS